MDASAQAPAASWGSWQSTPKAPWGRLKETSSKTGWPPACLQTPDNTTACSLMPVNLPPAPLGGNCKDNRAVVSVMPGSPKCPTATLYRQGLNGNFDNAWSPQGSSINVAQVGFRNINFSTIDKIGQQTRGKIFLPHLSQWKPADAHLVPVLSMPL